MSTGSAPIRAFVLVGSWVLPLLGLGLFAACGGGVQLATMNSTSSFAGKQSASGGARVTVGSYGLAGGNVVLQGGEPGYLFGTVKWPGADWTFNYFIVVKHGRDDGLDGEYTGAYTLDSSGTGAEKGQLRIRDRHIKVSYRMKGDPPGETLFLDAKAYNLAVGRVFVIDWTAEEPQPMQLPLDLKGLGPGHVDVKNVEEVAAKVAAEVARHPAAAAAGK